MCACFAEKKKEKKSFHMAPQYDSKEKGAEKYKCTSRLPKESLSTGENCVLFIRTSNYERKMVPFVRIE